MAQILVINCGTSSIKMTVFDAHHQRLWEGQAKGLGPHAAYREAMVRLLGQMQHALPSLTLHAIGHRVVHGGQLFTQTTRLTETTVAQLKSLIPLAPLHQPPTLEGIAIAQEYFAQGIPQYAVFDTAFHASIPSHAALYPLPLEWSELYRIRRYGFHGISHQYLWQRYLAEDPTTRAQHRVLTLHLGSGCSLAAIAAGHSIDTTMGFTPLEGLMMATRSGSIDPALIAYLMEQLHLSASEVTTLLNQRSGLLGISGLTGDMQTLLAQADRHPRARLAIDMFVYRVIKEAGALITVLGGVDALLFSGGIGENAPTLRHRLLHSLSWLGVRLDPAVNELCCHLPSGSLQCISTPASLPRAFVIATDENSVIASALPI